MRHRRREGRDGTVTAALRVRRSPCYDRRMPLRAPGFGLAGAVAVVTGGGAGLGRACAEALAGCGAAVALLERDAERAEATAAALTGAGAEVMALTCDVREQEQVDAAVEAVLRRHGRITHLVNNAGGVIHQAFAESTPRRWESMWRANLLSALLTTRRVEPHLGEGSAIVNVTSIEAHRAAPDFAVYAACKSGLASLTASLALELAPRVRVNAVAPDLIDTEGLRAVMPGGREPSGAHIPLRRAGRPEELAHAVLFLLSPLSSYITGTTIHVDGGTTAAAGWVPDGHGHYTLTGTSA